MDKKILLAGGGAAIMGVLFLRARASAKAAQAQAAAAQDQSNLALLSGTTPVSMGYQSSPSYDGGSTATVASASAPAATDTGSASATDPLSGMFAALLPMLQSNAANQHTENMAQINSQYQLGSQAINAGLYANDSGYLAALAGTGVDNATLSHDNGNTSISVVSPNQALIAQEYEKVLNRAPDTAGLAYWTNAIHDGTYNMGNFDAAFKNAAKPELTQPKQPQKATIQQAA